MGQNATKLTSCPPTQVTMTGSGHCGHGRHTISMSTAEPRGSSHGPARLDVLFSGSCDNTVYTSLSEHYTTTTCLTALYPGRPRCAGARKKTFIHTQQAFVTTSFNIQHLDFLHLLWSISSSPSNHSVQSTVHNINDLKY